MAGTPEELAKELRDAALAAGNLFEEVQKGSLLYLAYAKSQNESIKKLKEEKKSTKDITDAQKAFNKEAKIRLKTIIDNVKITKEYIKEEEKLRRIIERQTNGIKKYHDAYASLGATMKSVTGSAMGLVSAFGVQAITWDSLVKTSLSYNKSLFELSRMQNVAGRGFKDVGSTLKYVRENTKMGRVQFLELSNSMMKGFIGVKPSLQSVAQLLKVWGEQMGYDYDSAKMLVGIQAQFPPLFNKIAQGMQVIDKVNRGNATTQEKEHVGVLKAEAIAYGAVQKIATEQMDAVMQVMTPLTDQEKRYAELLKERAGLTQSVADLQVDLAKQLEPLQKTILKDATAIVKVMAEYKNITMGIGSAAVAMAGFANMIKMAQGLVVTFGIAGGAAFGWVAGIAVAVGLLATGISKWVSSQREAKEAAALASNEYKLQAGMQKDISTLTDIQVGQYKKLMDAKKGEKDTLKDTVAHHKEIMSEVKTEGGDVGILYKQYQDVSVTVEGWLKALESSSTTLKDIVGTTEEFGGLAEQTYQSLVAMSGVEIAQSMEKFRSSAEMVAKMLGAKGITLDINVDDKTLAKNLQDALTKAEKLPANDTERVKILSMISIALEAQNRVITKTASLTRSEVDMDTMRMRQQEKFSSVYEARLDTERKLMESAQFGLGASVSMMQKQVDLAYEFMKTYEEDDKNMQKRILSWGKINASQLRGIQNAKTQAEAEKIINGVTGLTTNEQQYLNAYAIKHQEISKKTMDQQQKIYDLTKDIREGYLDAIREMATGAGEFEKIIGTQDMGVTQLMDSVKDVTGMAKLNTMALGGLQEKALTGQGVGTGYTGQYGAGGISFIGGETQEKRNRRIYGYDKSVGDANAAIRGEVPGGRSTVGEANVPGAELYIAPEREAEIQGKIMGKEIAAQLSSPNYLSAVNKGIKGQQFSRGEAEKIEATAKTSGAMGGAYLNINTPPVPAGGGARRSSTGQGLGIPGVTVEEVAGGRKIYGQRVGAKPAKAQVDPVAEAQAKEAKELEETLKPIREKRMEAAKNIELLKGGGIEKLKEQEETAKKEAVEAYSQYTTKKPKKKQSMLEEYVTEPIAAGVGFAAGVTKNIAGVGATAWNAANDPDRKGWRENIPEWGVVSPFEEAAGYAGIDTKVEENKVIERTRSVKATAKYREKKKAREKAEEQQKDLKKQIADSKEQEKKIIKDRKNAKARAIADTTGQYEQNKEGDITTVWSEKGKVLFGEGEARGEEAENIRKRSMAEKKKAAGEEVESGAQSIREQLGTVKPKKGQTQGEAEYQAATKLFLKEQVEQYSQKDFEKAMAQREELKKSTGPLSKKGYAFKAASVEGDPAARKGFTSAAQAQGLETTEEQKLLYQQKAGAMADIYGATGEGEGGAGGMATLIVKFAKGLDGDIESVSGIRVELEHGVASTD